MLRLVVCALALLLGGGAIVGVAAPAEADVDPDVTVQITDVTPTELRDDSTVTLSGTVTNQGEKRWTKAQAYLVIAPSPFTTRQQVSDAVASESSYTGERVVELDAIDEIGTLEPGATQAFQVRVPYDQLGITGAEGVYPVGVQVLATAEDGTRSNAAIARATTFLPRLGSNPTQAPGGLVWPFVVPDLIGRDGTWTEAEDLLTRVSSGGQLRHLLDQALASPAAGTTILLDPALLVAVDDLASGRRLPRDLRLSDDQVEQARRFLDDLTGLARRVTCWTLGYARPDVLAISRANDPGPLRDVVDRATAQTLSQYQLSGRRVVWPTRQGVTSDLLEQVRGSGDRPVVVTRDAVPQWEPRLGSVVTRRTPAGPVPLFVDAGLDVGVPGAATVATLRQRLLSEAAFASLDRTADPESRADAFVLIDPTWDPGPANGRFDPTKPGTSGFEPAFDPDFVAPTDLEDLMSTGRAAYAGAMPRTTAARPVGPSQVSSIEQVVRLADLVADLAVDGSDLATRADRAAAGLLSVGWRAHRAAGDASAEATLDRLRTRLGRLTVEGPPAITLSSAEGSFPLTLSNQTDTAVQVGVQITASNPALSIPTIKPVRVEAGERRTVTVSVDVADQTSSTLTAQLVTPEGVPVGQADSFNVRSSRVGAALWVLMGAAGLFVLLALGRRFLRGRGGSGSTDRSTTDGTGTGEREQHD